MSMMEITTPQITTEENDAKNHAKIVVEPLERGFGCTLGNALRRTLLSDLPGFAAVGIKIDGVSHEFSTIPGVREDVVEIILNIKNIVFKANTDDKNFLFKTLMTKDERRKAKVPSHLPLSFCPLSLVFRL